MIARMLALGCAASLVAACGGGGEQPPAEGEETAMPAAEQGAMPAALPPDVQLAVDVARAIDAAPGSEDSILTVRGLTRSGLDSLMYAIAADSVKAAAYAAARR